MAKVMEIKDLAVQTMGRITSSKSEFCQFMETAARLPMHPVLDQVLIYEQRPEAEMVFSYEDWQTKGKCNVNRGAKGIALISENNYGGKVRYVFCDRSVTPVEGGNVPKKWRFSEEKSEDVLARLDEKYGVAEAEKDTEGYRALEGGMTENTVSRTAVAERLMNILEKECDEWLEANISPAQREDFGSLFKTMAIYVTLRRMGIDPKEGEAHYDFSALGRFNSPKALLILDKAVGMVVRPLLEEVRAAVILHDRKVMSRDQKIERTTVQEEHRKVEGREKRDGGEDGRDFIQREEPDGIRAFEAEVSEGADRSDVRGITAQGRAKGTFVGGAGAGGGDVPVASEEISGEDGNAGEVETDESHGVGTAEEHGGNAGKGNSAVEPDLYQSGAGDADGSFRVNQIGSNEAVVSYRIVNDHLGEGGAKKKFRTNIEAIRVLKRVENEKRAATADEQEILAGYVGWGGLSDSFSEKQEWMNEAQELRNLLTKDEYEAARATTLDSFYTSPVIIREIYRKLEDMGFRGGSILEPSMGVGNFFGAMPEDMRAGSRLLGVEKDGVSGRIARLLYPEVQIRIAGFEETQFPQESFDVVVGNIPFGDSRLYDRRFAKENFLIHDYFIARSLEEVRPGGIVALITSVGTMDKSDESARRYYAARAELLGAVRLPNNAFKANAGTDVTADILFFQKKDGISRDGMFKDNSLSEVPEWVHTTELGNGISINSYFAKNPEMMLGEMALVSGRYGMTQTLIPSEDAKLGEVLRSALARVEGRIISNVLDGDMPERESSRSLIQIGESGRKAGIQEGTLAEGEFLPADESIPNYSYVLVGNDIYFRADSLMQRQEGLSEKTVKRIKGLIPIRDCVRELINMQLAPEVTDEELRGKMMELTDLYESFVGISALAGTIGGVKVRNYINTAGNRQAFGKDASFPLLSSLEILDEDGNVTGVSDIFTKRTVLRVERITHADTAMDALSVSLNEKGYVDLPFMAMLTGQEDGELISELSGVIYLDPADGRYKTAEEYLSGNIRTKIRIAEAAQAEDMSGIEGNLAALKAVEPAWIEAADIGIQLGATWLPVSYVKDFMAETFQTPEKLLDKIYPEFAGVTGRWEVKGKSLDKSAFVTMEYGTGRRNAYELLETALNLGMPRVYDIDSDGNRVLNRRETILAQQMMDKIKAAFHDWLLAEPERRREIETVYNERFNAVRPREYDGSYLTFPGMNPEIQLYEHQKNAIAHVLHGGNTLLAHAVGAGKTFEMVASAMEAKRLGMAHKSLIVVPDYLTEQWGSDFLRLYPGANVLVARKSDFETRNRKRFCARIATGNYDAVIIGHTQFDKIPISQERQKRILKEQVEELVDAIQAAKAQSGEKTLSVKEMEKKRRSLEEQLKKMSDSPKDDAVTFEQLGIDRLFVDESHLFKNLQTHTKMSRVAGVSTSASKRAQDMYNKCRYMDELTGGRGIVFASGTAISNSMTEMYTLMRYLIHDRLAEYGIGTFDEWASAFGQTVSAIELSPEGKGYRQKTRFSRFFNLPELVSLFKTFADVRTADMLKLDVPEAEYVDVTLDASEAQTAQVEALVERAKKVRAGQVEPNEDNMLAITNDGRKAALDERLLNPSLPPNEGSKAAECARQAYEIWKKTADFKGTQLIFCDLSTPKTDKAYTDGAGMEPDVAVTDGSFTVYEDIRGRLVRMGVPKEEIVFIHEAKTDVQKAALFAKVRSGQVRFLLGSTGKMGAGMNVQTMLVALHHLDAPWRPADMSQREGRIIRQGNQNEKVWLYRYLKKGTFDQYMWQTLKNKQQFISQILTSRTPVRAAEDIDESVIQYSQVLALTVENPDIREKMELDIEMEKLRTERSAFLQNQYRMQDLMSVVYPREIKELEEQIRNREADRETVQASMEVLRQKAPERARERIRMEFAVKNAARKEKGLAPYTEMPEAAVTAADTFEMRVGKAVCHNRKDAGARLLTELFSGDWEDGMVLGEYMGLTICGQRMLDGNRGIVLVGKSRYPAEMGMDAVGNLARIDHLVEKIGTEAVALRERLDSIRRDLEIVKGQIGKAFEKETEFQEKSARLAELNARLELGDGQDTLIGESESALEEAQGVEKTMEAEIKEIHCKDGTVRLRVMDYQAKHQFAGILKNENVLPEEVAEKKAEMLEKIRQMEYRLDFPDFDDIIYETDDSVSGGLKIAHEMNGKVGTTGAQYCYLFRRIHSLLDEIRRDERTRGVLDTVKEYDQKRGKILEWEETAEGWKNEYMTIPDDDSVVKGWGVCRPYQMRTFCETVKRETVKEAMRNLEKFGQEEQQEIAKKAFAEVFRETHRSLEIDFEQESASVIVKMVSDEEYICACAFYGTGEWKYPEASIKEAYEEGSRFYKEVKSRKDQMDRSVDVKELCGFAIGMKESFEKGLITEEHYNRFVQMGRELVRQVDGLAKGNAAYGLYVRYAVEYGLEEPDYRKPKTREQAVAVLELMKNTFEMFPELEKDGKMYSFYHGQLAGVGEKAFYAEKSEMRER